ncbi:MAG TPA: Npt1/Npt2 family nucleotide transporter [Rubrivivax sp.]
MSATDSAAATATVLPPEPSLPSRPLERTLRLFADVREGEGPRLLALTFNVFLILVAYYVMKPVREVLILAQPGGAELKSYAYAAQAVLFVVLVPLYGAVAARLPRRALINGVTALFIACLPVFYLLAERGVFVGLVFFLWIGVFSLMVVAQFWAYANDVYTPAAGKRLFAVIAFGASAGAVAGAWLSGRLIDIIGVHALLLAAAVVLGVSLAVFNAIDRHDSRRRRIGRATDDPPEQPIGGRGAFALVARNRYLLGMALVILLLNWVNSAGEYVLSAIVKQAAEAEIAAGRLTPADQGRYIGAFFADYFQLVNVIGLVLQLFFVSRLVKWLGVPVALCVLPLVALGSYAAAMLLPSLAIVRWAKTAENAVDYSLMNSVRQMLFLPTTREEKYKAKQVIDSLVVRSGDVLAAGTVYLGTTVFALGVSQFAAINVVLVLAWLAASVATGLEFRRRSAMPAGVAACARRAVQ